VNFILIFCIEFVGIREITVSEKEENRTFAAGLNKIIDFRTLHPICDGYKLWMSVMTKIILSD
jgi:hypothetical protein